MDIIETKKIHILLLNNNFRGSYESNQVFYNEIIKAFNNKNIEIITVDSLNDAINAYERGCVDFSVCFSKYCYFINETPLYDIYKIPNYQWVSDNPLKMNMDSHSDNIIYIFIDKEYELVANMKNKPLYLPLGFLEENYIPPHLNKLDAVLMPCKIRNLKEIESDIMASEECESIKEFLDQYEFDESFIKSLRDFMQGMRIKNIGAFFRLTNEYTRVKKRICSIKKIKKKKVFIVGDDYGNFNNQIDNVEYISKCNYSAIGNLMNKFRYVLNVDPNYDYCIHDRFIRSVSSGTVCITNQNQFMNKWNGNTYKFSSESNMDGLIEKIDSDYDEEYFEQYKMVRKYSWDESIKSIINNFLYGIGVDGYAI